MLDRKENISVVSSDKTCCFSRKCKQKVEKILIKSEETFES